MQGSQVELGRIEIESMTWSDVCLWMDGYRVGCLDTIDLDVDSSLLYGEDEQV